jgi:hypothetical protein
MAEKQEDENIILRKLLHRPQTLGFIAYNMGWAYSTTSQKLQVLVAGGECNKIIKGKQTLYYIKR